MRRELIREGIQRAVARRSLALVRAGLCFAVAVAVAAAVTTTRTDGAAAADAQVSRGRDTVRVVGAGASPVTAASCDAVAAIDGVRAAGGYRAAGPATLSNGVRAQVVAATPGFVRYLTAPVSGDVGVAGERRSSPIAVGRELAARAGIGGGTAVVLDGAAPVRASRLPDTPRAGQWADSLFVLTPPSALVDECWVELDPWAAGSTWPQVEAVVDGARPLSVGPVDRDAVRETPPETRAAALSAWRGGLAVGVVALLVSVLTWWADREGWALYTAIGFDRRAVAAIAFVDWALLAMVPIVAGTLWGSVAGADGEALIEPATRLAAGATAVAALANPWLRVLLARSSLRRALAGL